ncbi:MAG: DMT family transporter [Bacteroidales bacterium]|nr:DMT family transporter [Bacteroidales bacterium]
MTNGTNPARGHICMLTANMLWGLMAPISKDTLNYFDEHGISAFVLVACRVAGAAVAFWILSLFVRHGRTASADRRQLLFAALLSVVFNQCMFIVGVSYTSSIDASVITTMLPIITMLLAAEVLREPITSLKAFGVGLGMSGAILLILGNGQSLSFDRDHIIGDLMCLAAQISFAAYLVFFKKLISRLDAVQLMKWMFLWATLAIVPFTVPELSKINYAEIPASVYWEVCYTVFVATFITYLLLPFGQRSLRPTTVSMYNYVQPVVSTTVSLVWGISTFGVIKGIAIALVFVGVYAVTQSKSRQQIENEKNKPT